MLWRALFISISAIAEQFAVPPLGIPKDGKRGLGRYLALTCFHLAVLPKHQKPIETG